MQEKEQCVICGYGIPKGENICAGCQSTREDRETLIAEMSEPDEDVAGAYQNGER